MFVCNAPVKYLGYLLAHSLTTLLIHSYWETAKLAQLESNPPAFLEGPANKSVSAWHDKLAIGYASV